MGHRAVNLIYQQDQVQIDPSRITIGEHPLFGPTTTFHDVVIASEIVQAYEDGMAWKPADELEDYTWTVEGRWTRAGGHPETPVIMDRVDISGRTVNSRFTKSLKDHKTGRKNRRGVLADIEMFDDKIAPQLLADMKAGKKPDVSIGFFFARDATPGVVEDGSLKGAEYDYVQRSLTHDHLAVAIEDGRCPTPYCGLGADELVRKIAQDPFAGFKNHAECVERFKEDPNIDDPDAFCAYLEQREKKKKKKKSDTETVKKFINSILVESKEEDEMDKLLEVDWKQYADVYEALPEELQDKITEAGKCPDCNEITIEADLSLEQINEKLKTLKEQREALRKKARKLEDELYSEPETEKKRKKQIREKMTEIWDDLDGLYDEIRAYTEAKTLKITQSAMGDEEGEEGQTDKEGDTDEHELVVEEEKPLDPMAEIDRFTEVMSRLN